MILTLKEDAVKSSVDIVASSYSLTISLDDECLIVYILVFLPLTPRKNIFL